MSLKPTLVLLPNLLENTPHHEMYLPSSIDKAVLSLNGLIAESEKEGRRYLSRFMPHEEALKVPLALYNEHSKDDELAFLLEPLRKGEKWGVVSDCGLPCIADPGYKLVQKARQTGIAVQAFVGPSSIFLALMLSGMPAQQFSFCGYVPKDPERLKRWIVEKEQKAKKERSTQIFMETPYRNQALLEALMSQLHEKTHLAVAWSLTSPDQGVLSQQVKIWKKSPLPNLHKKPAIYLISP